MEIREEYEKRVIEIDSFYEILKIIELESPKLIAYNIDKGEESTLMINSARIDTLRSTTYLLLYNLIESTVYNSIIIVFDKINDENLSYYELIENVRKYWVKNLYKHDIKKSKESIVSSFMKIADKIFDNEVELISNEINYGGSLDARTIFSTAESMKIKTDNIRQIYDKNLHGQSLIEIKQKRNWLAHGEKSFIEVGSNVTFSQLVEIRNCVYAFLNEFIISVECYAENQHYKLAESSTQPSTK